MLCGMFCYFNTLFPFYFLLFTQKLSNIVQLKNQ